MIALIPAYEPDEKLLPLVDALLSRAYTVVVVDDGSSPAAQPIFAPLPAAAILLRHPENRGKGRAIKTACEYIAAHFPPQEGVVTVDADGQHLPADIDGVCRAWRQNPEALVLGSRRFTGKVPLRSRFGNGVTRFIFRVATGVAVYDTQTGLRALSAPLAKRFLTTKGERF